MKLLISLIVPLLVGFLGSYFTSTSVNTWFLTLEKPFFNPPSWVFAPVWTILYLLMGLAFYFIWQKKCSFKVYLIYFIQLFLNFTWSLLFFGLQAPLLAFFNIILLLIAITFNIIWFYPCSKKAAYLLIPYFFWVGFASCLNLAIVLLN